MAEKNQSPQATTKVVKKEKTTRDNVEQHISILIDQKNYSEALDLVRRFKPKGITVTLSTLKKDYKLTTQQIDQLAYVEVENPHYAKSAPMKLYLKAEVEALLNGETNMDSLPQKEKAKRNMQRRMQNAKSLIRELRDKN